MAVEFKLKTPIELGDETVEVLELQEPTVEKLQRCRVNLSEEALSTVDGMSKLLVSCSKNVGEAHIKKMMLSDLVNAIGVCTDFFE
jgi:hypothetical protein